MAYPRRSSSSHARSSPSNRMLTCVGHAPWRKRHAAPPGDCSRNRVTASTIAVRTVVDDARPRCRPAALVSTSGGDRRSVLRPAPSTSRPRLKHSSTSRSRSLVARSLVCAIAHQLDADHQPLAAHVADQRVLVLQRAQPLHQVRADLRRVGHQRILEQLDRRQRRGARHRVAAERARVRARRPRHHSARAVVTPSGRPDATPLATAITSGSTPKCSMANILPVRPIPDCTSSAISSMPCLRVSSRSR